jgi:hypothetical protein
MTYVHAVLQGVPPPTGPDKHLDIDHSQTNGSQPIPSDEGSPPTSPQGAMDLDNFTVVERGRWSTPIHAAVPLAAVTSLTTTGNRFGILDDAPLRLRTQLTLRMLPQ